MDKKIVNFENNLSRALNWANQVWPSLGGLQSKVLPGDGSPRIYVRLFKEKRRRLLLIGPDFRENKTWLLLGRQFWFSGFPLPRIYEANLEEGFFLLEDLGTNRLDSFILTKDMATINNIYGDIVLKLAYFHDKALNSINGLNFPRNQDYDYDFVWEKEWNYFIDSFKLLKYSFDYSGFFVKEGQKLCRLVTSIENPVLIHRDFQSRNIMIKKQQPFFLDWQGARIGPAPYDLASLLYDPYLENPEILGEDFISIYLKARKTVLKENLFRQNLLPLAIMRLMQAHGAYAHLSLNRGKKSFAKYLSTAEKRLASLSDDLNPKEFPLLKKFLAALVLLNGEEKCQ